MNSIRKLFKDLAQYPSAIIGLTIIGLLIALAIYAVISIPYNEALRLWRGGEEVWIENPRTAGPAWFNLFTSRDQPVTMVLNTEDGTAEKSVEATNGMQDVWITFDVDFPFDDFPRDISLFVTSSFESRRPHLDISWITPDGREIRVGELSPARSETYRINQDDRLLRRLDRLFPQLDSPPVRVGLFADPDQETAVPLKGTYQLLVNAILFEEDSDIEAKLVVYGELHGLAGTDHRRRDLTVALLWGTPIALSFGLFAALGTTVTTMIIAAIGIWFGGVVDAAIQRITEVNLILPLIPILIMIATFRSRSIWLMLGVVVLLGILSASIKTYRAIFLQTRESPFVEAARAYGASSWRIIFLYLIPRIIPIIVPSLVILVPSYVFLEASLAVLGLGDPILPTWGKVINDAYISGALHNAWYYWVLMPSVLLMITGFAFSMVGFALDRIFNPRLRGL
ncbi:MAG: ABC transporter permease [Anaerolineales bacterium]|nr:ABC transporter permease [Anaerolineales bacterium]